MNILGRSVHNSNPYNLYLCMRAVAAFAFSLIITYEVVYHTLDVGLNPLQLVTVGVVLECMTLFFEIPTGIVADAYSRRLSVLIGYFLIGTGFLVEAVSPTFAAVLAAQVLWGLGFTFYSGAGDAWLTDEVGEERAATAFLRGTQIGQVSSLLGVVAGLWLVGYGLTWPILVGALLYYALVIVLLWTMTEEGFQPAAQKQNQNLLAKMGHPLREGISLVKVRPVLPLILFVGVVIGLCIGGFDRLYAAHLTENFTLPTLGTLEPVAWFSILSAVIALLSLGGMEIVRRLREASSTFAVAEVLFVLYSGMIVFTLLFVLTQQFMLAAVGFCVSQTLRNIGRPLLIIWINQHTDSQVRATVISMYWQSNAFGQIVGSPIVGWIGTLFSLRVALTAATIVYMAVLPLLKRAGNLAHSDVSSH